MRAVDTNVLVRLLTRDDETQTAAAEAFVAQGAWVSTIVLTEAMWVLRYVYSRSAIDIAKAIEMLLDHQTLTVQSAETVQRALAALRSKPSIDFSDCLILQLARDAGHLPLGTFDRNLSKLEGAQRLAG
jgi:predicted nucleic-acid-binding protein